MNGTANKHPRWLLPVAGILLALAGLGAGWAWRGHGSQAATERIVHDYIVNNPEVIPQAMDNLRAKENAKQLASVGDAVETPFPGAVLGNPAGKVTLVEFIDFACGYCRASEREVEGLINANPDLKVVIRQLPILSPASHDAARMGLAAAEQGKYHAFHRAMFAAGKPDAQTIDAAARVSGLDLARAGRVITEPRIDAELDANIAMARELGFEGTPSWVIGDEIYSGAVGQAKLAQAIAKVRG